MWSGNTCIGGQQRQLTRAAFFLSLQGASVKEQLIEACRRNNVDLLQEIISNCKNDDEISNILNNTTTVMGNHLYHEAALQGNCAYKLLRTHVHTLSPSAIRSIRFIQEPGKGQGKGGEGRSRNKPKKLK